MNNKSFCIIGLGSFGQSLALELAASGSQVMVVDVDENKVNLVADYVTNAIIGDPTNERFLESSGIKDYDTVVICLANNINSSILLTVNLKELGVGRIVTRASSEIERKILKKVGADLVVFPEKDVAEKIATMLSKSKVLDYIELSDTHSIVEIPVLDKWLGKSLVEINVRRQYGVNVIAIKTAESTKMNITFDPAYKFRSGDVVTAVGEVGNIDKMIKDVK